MLKINPDKSLTKLQRTTDNKLAFSYFHSHAAGMDKYLHQNMTLNISITTIQSVSATLTR